MSSVSQRDLFPSVLLMVSQAFSLPLRLTRTHTHTHTHTRTHSHTQTHTHTHRHRLTHTHTHIHTRAHTLTQTHTRFSAPGQWIPSTALMQRGSEAQNPPHLTHT